MTVKGGRMNRTEKAAAGMLAGVKAGHLQAKLDKRLAADAARAGDVGMMPLDAVLGRVGNLDTREPTPEAVDTMTETLDALGLIVPLAVDCRGRLLCGKTRLLALRRLKAKDPDRWGKVPVRRYDFDAEADPARALAVEVAENEQRKAYTPAEVRALAERLRGAGFRATAGRPRKGTRALLPALGAVVGKSKRQLLRILNPDAAPPEKMPLDAFLETLGPLVRALKNFVRVAWEVPVADMTPAHRRAQTDAAKLAEVIGKLLAEYERGHHAEAEE